MADMAIHYMEEENGDSQSIYQENITKLAPILIKLANVTRVVWLNQYPLVDYHGVIHSEKIHNYNKIVRRILENGDSQIRIWDSSNPLAEEYVRGCATLKRDDEQYEIDDRPSLLKDYVYADCNDNIHTGYSALSQATQLLFNDICQTS
uniref:Uncharacterized protein n=1 Tax=Daphnia galeata TaxID=27404 RepID=A0A8J2WLG7_9CRUS|nr:unnamed protein product [Daphnia galeata]